MLYLQGIESISKETGAPVKGYILASLARSHRQDIGSFPEVTEIYLKDAIFTGYTPEFIAFEMFERGVFGFIPHYAGSDYVKLPVKKQTQMIKILGIDSEGVEKITCLMEAKRIEVRQLLMDIFQSKGHMGEALQRIASGAAAGKQDGNFCLLTAVGKSCTESERSGCIGCRYEIYTKTAMYEIVREYRRR